ncbi:MAG: tetratricopeptide repeat protein [Pyrinomonadaceae bacterium]
MRSAERHVAQGKIQSAIAEYKHVVANDPKDFGTLNMLGDLYTKNSEVKNAVKCYTSVAEHYSKQGFAQKAIAVYNKISKIQPGSIEISAKLADLYRFKGSINEARTHFKIVAEHYESEGQKIEALEVRKQMAALDPTDTAIHLTLAAAYLEEDQHEEAAEAFTEAGTRLAKKSKHAEAVEAFGKALDIRPTDEDVLAAFTQSHFAIGTASDAARRLEEIRSSEPHNSEVLCLLIDCYLESGNTADAEKAVVSLVEKEPANYPKLVELSRIYLKNSDAESAGRIMAMSSEHLLLAGEADEFQSLITEILSIDPEQLEGLRLRARLAAWQRDEAGMQESLARLATVARVQESVDDERFALSQLVMIAPHETDYADRLKEINEQFGYDNTYAESNLFDEQFLKSPAGAAPDLETFAPNPVDVDGDGIVDADDTQFGDFAIVGDTPLPAEPAEPAEADSDFENDDGRLLRESDSIRFYIDSGYLELAEKAIGEIRSEFGGRPEIEELVKYLELHISADGVEVEGIDASPALTPDVHVPPASIETVSTNGNHAPQSSGFGIDDLRNELGIDDADNAADADYDTHYHTAVAYQEMGLLDEAIKEYQEAVGLVQPNDQMRRFFHCANLLGHCFMQKSMAKHALTWYQRALESPGLGDEEKQGIWYELALAYEAAGDLDNAGRFFEQVYAENIDFRDVSQRVKNIAVEH